MWGIGNRAMGDLPALLLEFIEILLTLDHWPASHYDAGRFLYSADSTLCLKSRL